MLVVVGGHSRNIGKTSVVEGILARFRSRNWAALKITQYGNGICAKDGGSCGCAPDEPDHPVVLSEEFEPGPTDSGRYLAAGARRSFWLRTPAGRLEEAVPQIRRVIAAGDHAIVESNSIVEFLTPDAFLMVVDFGCEDFKPSSLRFLDRADALIVIDRGMNVPLWQDVSRGLWDHKKQFLAKPPHYVTTAVSSFVRERLSAAPRAA